MLYALEKGKSCATPIFHYLCCQNGLFDIFNSDMMAVAGINL